MVTFREHTSNWSPGQPGYTPPIERNIPGGRVGKPNSIGHCPIYDTAGKLVGTPHWTDIKDYFPNRPGYF